MKRTWAILVALVGGLVGAAARADDVALESMPPVVVETVPEAGAGAVDPKLAEIRVTFSKDMQDGSWSWSTLSKESFPRVDGKPKYLSDKRTCVLPVKLEPGTTYAIWLNSAKFGNFKDADGRPAVPYLLVFKTALAAPPSLDTDAASAEVSSNYRNAQPEVQEFVLLTARSFGPSGLWLSENAYSGLKPRDREERIDYLVELFDEAEYGRHLCSALAEASALKDPKLVRGLKKVAAYHADGSGYDCRPKWMAIAALARLESPDAVPLLVSLVDHFNRDTRFWARAALSRMAKDDFKADKQAWNQWWIGQGHDAIDPALLAPYAPLLEK
ncbi:MAG: Ig-like domain-containing protein [Planctomycetes bacterium]|nr:Ig-like domain-containing protein [Planctomycetota bacterium]